MRNYTQWSSHWASLSMAELTTKTTFTRLLLESPTCHRIFMVRDILLSYCWKTSWGLIDHSLNIFQIIIGLRFGCFHLTIVQGEIFRGGLVPLLLLTWHHFIYFLALLLGCLKDTINCLLIVIQLILFIILIFTRRHNNVTVNKHLEKLRILHNLLHLFRL